MSDFIPNSYRNDERDSYKDADEEEELIDIHELNNARDFRFKQRIATYDTFLKRCIQKIKTITRERSFCLYKVPLFSIGVPLYDRNKCIYYIYHKLKHLGFEVRYNPDTSLYISWGHITSYVKEPDLKKKKEVEKQTKEIKEKAERYRNIQDANNMIKNNFIYNMNEYSSNSKSMFK